MFRRIFKRIMGTAGHARPWRQTPAEGELPRRIMTLLISGPAGGTDPVLHALLLDGAPSPSRPDEQRKSKHQKFPRLRVHQRSGTAVPVRSCRSVCSDAVR